ncbi:MAG: diguanylate cyclase [Candidatus Gastranaerophilaceae bacterium]|nr:diguanylate cyclase [Candidatus Gastranaerophilaceae bacterium]
MGFFDKINEVRQKISEVENNIYHGKEDYLEIYERNLQLEKEIEERTKELNIANKRMLSLQGILDMMNSAKPLRNVLETVVNNIQGELGYLHSTIMRKESDADGEYFVVVAEADDITIKRADDILKTPIQARRLAYTKDSIFYDSIENRHLVKSKDIGASLKAIMPDITDEQLNEILNDKSVKSIITIPLIVLDKPFGIFAVFSSREDLAEPETDFLNMYAQQIELAITIAELFEKVKEQAVTDGLTGLYNRRYFEEYLKKEVTRSLRINQPFSIIGLDLDFLKKINDTYGHSFGDVAIKTIADVLKTNARSIDTAARMGGEEFNVILPGVTSEGAMIAAERIRKAIENVELDTIGHITASIGVATFLEHSDNIEDILELTDQAMYMSKRNGRNQVTLAKPMNETSWQELAVSAFLDILNKKKIPLSEDFKNDLSSKLLASTPQSEVLYSVADLLTQTYNDMHVQGGVKLKVLTAVSLAKRFDLPKSEIDNLKIAMLLYDIGNLLIPQEIFKKKEPLTSEDKQHIYEHPVIAAQEILKPISYIQDVIPIVASHHENWDGTGYPAHLSHESIPLASQIVLIVDAFYALTEQRSYRDKLSPRDALEIIKKDTDKKWNKTLVDEFVALIENDLK